MSVQLGIGLAVIQVPVPVNVARMRPLCSDVGVGVVVAVGGRCILGNLVTI